MFQDSSHILVECEMSHGCYRIVRGTHGISLEDPGGTWLKLGLEPFGLVHGTTAGAGCEHAASMCGCA